MIKLLLLNTQIHTAVFAPISKLGLYYKFEPSKYTDSTYTIKTVVKGHDGSIWVGYNDLRDDIVLEFEKRVYNNIKTQHQDDIFDYAEVTPDILETHLMILILQIILLEVILANGHLKIKLEHRKIQFNK